MQTVALLILAVIPPMGFLVYILWADRREPEPLGLILLTMLAGAVSGIPAAIVEVLLGMLGIFNLGGLPGAVIASFIQISPVEEACKIAVVLLFIWKNKNFNEENDGIVYATASAIGFAMLENVFYVISNGFATGIARALTSIPLHTFCGVVMGFFIGRARFAPDKKQASSLIWKGFILAWFIHGLYDTFALSGTAAALLLLPLVIAIFIVGIIFIKRGRKLSLERWANPENAAQIKLDTPVELVQRQIRKYPQEKIGQDEEGRYFLKPEKQKWKAVTGRVMLAVSALFWIFVVLGLSFSPGAESDTVPLVIIFSVITTSMPILIGILLEVSYRRRLALPHYF